MTTAPATASASTHVHHHHPPSINWECPKIKDLHSLEEDVTLDPETNHPNLVLCAKYKCVRWEAPEQDLPDNPERFGNLPCVLGSEGFTSGKHYWEVAVGNQRNWAVGVAKASVSRKGCINLIPDFGVWAQVRQWVGCGSVLEPVVRGESGGGGGSSISEHREGEAERLLPQGAETIGVFLEYGKGRVTFFEQDRLTIMQANFGGEEVFPFFYVGSGVHLKVIS